MAPKYDNQGRDLDATKLHLDYLEKLHREGIERSNREFERTIQQYPLADWTMLNNVLVLRCGQSRFVAVPRGNKKMEAANFDVLDMVKLEPVTILSKKEVRNWLWRASQNADAEARGFEE